MDIILILWIILSYLSPNGFLLMILYLKNQLLISLHVVAHFKNQLEIKRYFWGFIVPELKMNKCYHVMKDGRVCGKNCFREKCHYHTSARMEKDKLFHKNQRIQRRTAPQALPLKDPKDVQDVKDAHDALASPSSKISCATPEKSLTMQDQKESKQSSHTSDTPLASHTFSISNQDRLLCEKIGSVERWVYEAGKKINSLSIIPDGFTSKRDMILCLLEKLIKDVYEIKHHRISKNDFYSRVKRHYAEIAAKYGSALKNL